jgi:membrane protease YdiL (CAAX protease family)
MTLTHRGSGVATGHRSVGRRWSLWTALTCLELALATTLVVLDVLIPSVLLVVLAGISLLVRRRGFASLGFHRVERPWMLTGQVLVAVLAWSLLQLGLVMPVLNHLTGERQDLSAFEDLQGNVGLLVLLLLASWLLGALIEETAVRGYLQTGITEVLGAGRWGILVAVLFTSVLFSVLHTEQGVVGVVVTFLDALFLSWLRWHHGTLWASILGHGLSNTVGVVTFFLVGPVYGLW